jgi:hypothetical protein
MCRLMVALQPTAQNIGPMGDFRPGRLALPDRRRVFHEQRKSPVSKLIAQSYRDGRAPKWVAVDTSIKLSNSTK